ncbi:ATP-binding protein [Calidithermus roseus]|uniref:histidine kinase n=1 Tax=Calidithermus roseus TaxID=1644118 RepID=A0A399ECQ4_9DEIN|nr:ATP-binding protein [Calidithermus roseus]RIH82447.1 Virulence sensor protein BvgS [Calidithermus roseus]
MRSGGRLLSRAWLDWPLWLKGLVVVGLPVLALLFVLALSLWLRAQESRWEDRVEQTLLIQQDLRGLLGLLVDAETGLRGYALTRKLGFLEPYQQAREKLPAAQSRLELSLGRESLTPLTPLIERRLQVLENARQAVVQGNPALLELHLEEGKTLMDALRQGIANLDQQLQLQLEQARAGVERQRQLSLYALSLSGLLGLLGGVGAAVLFTRGISRRMRRLGENAFRVARGQSPLDLPPGNDEVGQLGQALQQAQQLLEESYHQLREREATLEALFKASPDVITLLDHQGRIRLTNPANYELLGVAPEERLGQLPSEAIHPEDYPQVAETLQELLSGRRSQARLRVRYRHPQGHWLTLEAHAQALPAEGDRVPGVVVVSRDISTQAELEEALSRARLEAESANRAKSEFLSRMSHELRTPLNAILGFAQLLELDAHTQEEREGLERILKAGRHLLDLINEVLDLARIEAGRMALSIEPMRPAEVVQECLNLMGSLAASRLVQLEFPQPEECRTLVLADRQRLRQILLNLLSNAIKYNREGGRVTLSCQEVAGDMLRLSVSDTGPGIAPELLHRLFTPFDRLGAEATVAEGTGLGLALSKRLAEAMQGRLGVESVVGKGSTFWLELPQVEAPPPLLEEAREVLAPGAALAESRTVLYIEDNLSNLRLVEHILARKTDFRLIAAMQGSLGLTLAREHRPDLILLDLHLPDVPGHEVLARLRADPLTQGIPVIILSAEASPGQVQRLLAQGAAAYLTKPLEVSRFLEVLAQVLKR